MRNHNLSVPSISITIKADYLKTRTNALLIGLAMITFLFLSIRSSAQSYEIDAFNGQTVTTCSGTFYDSGGSGGNYGINENYHMTFVSASGQFLTFDFSVSGNLNIDAGTGDTLYFYNGAATSGTPIAFLTNSDDVAFSQLMINTLSDSVTVVWHSDGVNVDGGWNAVIGCQNPPVCAGNPPASDIFGQATFICNLNNYCGTTASYYGEDLPYNLVGGGDCPVPIDGIFGGTVENNSWLAFQATSTSASFEFTVTNCTGNGIQVGIFGFNGSAFNLVSPCSLTDGAQGGTFTVTASALTIGSTYYIMIDGNAGANCDYVIHANNGVAVISAGPDQSVCAGSPVNLSASGPSGATYQWSSLDGLIVNVNGGNQTFNPLVTTSYVVTAIGAGLCEAQKDTVVVTVTSIANATINPAGPFCVSASPLTLTAATAGGTWSGTGITNTATGEFSPAAAGVGSFDIIYTISGSCGSADTTTISVNLVADATITPAGPFCVSATPVTLTAATAGGTWSGTGITNIATGEFSPAAAGVGSFDIIYTISGICGNADTTTISVTLIADATITPAGPFCAADAPVLLIAATTGGSWSGTGITNAITGQFSPVTAGNGTFEIIYTISGSCGSADTTLISVNAMADATITPAGPFCAADAPVLLIAATTGGSWSGTGITNAITGQFSPVTAGNGTFEIIYTISGSCGNADTTLISVNAMADATITPAGPFCTSSAAVNLNAVNAGGTWTGTGITNGSNGTFDPAIAGSGNHEVIYTISGACGDADTTIIVVMMQADASISPAGPFCADHDAVNLTAANAGGTWSGNGITNTSLGTFDPGVAGEGNHMIIYQITGTCGNADTLDLLIHANPVAVSAATEESCTGAADGTAEVLVTQGTSPYSYLWNNMATTSNQSGLAPGLYSVLVTDANGCTVTDETEVLASFTPCEIIIPAIFIPNIFSPNGDGSNDVFFVRGQGIKSLTFKVYDRWGELVFETTDLANGWDGTYRSKQMDDAVYVYTVDATFENGDVFSEKGNISLLR